MEHIPANLSKAGDDVVSVTAIAGLAVVTDIVTSLRLYD
jgi:hypothetical protein